MKKRLSLMVALVLAIALIIPGQSVYADSDEKSKDIVILYTNDVHCAVDRTASEDGGYVYSFGYPNIAAYKNKLMDEYENVMLVDAGDHLQGGAYGVLSKGLWMTELMNAAKYDLAVPGNHEFDYMIPGLDECMYASEFVYLSCNFIDKESGEAVLLPYAIYTMGAVNVAFIGVTTPESFTKSTPKYFMDENGEFLYSFCEGGNGQELYDKVQDTVDEVREMGADYVVAITHLGVDPSSSPWTSTEVISNTSGIDIVIDGHSHTSVPMEFITDAKGEKVIVTQTGTKFASFGKLTIAEDGTIKTELITAKDAPEQDEDVIAVIDEIVDQSAEKLSEVAGASEYPLCVSNPETGLRMVRVQESNAGDFVADAYRTVTGADIAVVNGGGLRFDIPAGKVTVGQLINLHPFGNEICMVKTSGQHIADLLEMAVSKLSPEMNVESGSFQHTSGMTYEVDLTIPSPVKVTEQGNFESVDGQRRVFNIKVYDDETGMYLPLDLDGEYTLASHNYLLKSGGSGLNMFLDDELVIDGLMMDYQAVVEYFEMCSGVVPEEYSDFAGQGRITLYTDANEALAAREAAKNLLTGVLPKTGVVGVMSFLGLGSMLMGAGAVILNRKKESI